MSVFEVEYSCDAEDDLADFWFAAPDRAAVTRAEKIIFDKLQADPFSNGRIVAEALYRIVEAPLAMYYTINADDRRVVVERIRLRL